MQDIPENWKWTHGLFHSYEYAIIFMLVKLKIPTIPPLIQEYIKNYMRCITKWLFLSPHVWLKNDSTNWTMFVSKFLNSECICDTNTITTKQHPFCMTIIKDATHLPLKRAPAKWQTFDSNKILKTAKGLDSKNTHFVHLNARKPLCSSLKWIRDIWMKVAHKRHNKQKACFEQKRKNQHTTDHTKN